MLRWRPRTVLLVTVFVLLDLAIIAFAFGLSRRGGEPAAAGTGSAVASPSSSASEGSTLSGPLTLSASPTGALARVTRGSCDSRDPARARVWVAASNGSAMTPRTVPGLVESLGVDYRRRALTIVGADSACKVHGYTSVDAGVTWKTGEVPGNIWWLDLDSTSTKLHGPVTGGTVDLECVAISVSTVSDGALAGCRESGYVRLDRQGRVAAGSEGTIPGVVAAAADGQDRVLVLANTAECPAQLLLVRPGKENTQVSCFGTDVAPLGLAVSGARWFVQVGYRLAVSDNEGRRFTTYAKDPVAATNG